MAVNVEFHANMTKTFESGHKEAYTAGKLYTFLSATVLGGREVMLIDNNHGELKVSLDECNIYGKYNPGFAIINTPPIRGMRANDIVVDFVDENDDVGPYPQEKLRTPNPFKSKNKKNGL